MNLKDEIVAGESYSLEFKRVPNEKREKYLKTVVAFANGKGGRILFGVANDRTVVGIPNERYVEGWGSGFLRLNEELSAYGARPVEIEDAGFATRLNVYRVVANTPADKQEDNEGNREGNEGNAAERVLSVLKRNPKASIIALSKELGISHATIERTEKALQTVGRIRRKGGTRGVWEVL